MELIESLKRNIKNIPGRTIGNRKIVVIYIDDFGSIRVKDKRAYQTLKEAGLNMDGDRYAKWDTLASREDMEILYDALTSVKDQYGHHACMTPFTNVANPDFERIRESGFTEYYREPFTETLKKYGSAYEGVFELWKQGIAENIFYPAYHGTEHLNVIRFMKRLQEGHRSTRLAFDNESVCVPRFADEDAFNKDAVVFYIEDASENVSLKEDIIVGTRMMEELFGYRSKQFTPGAGAYSPDLHGALLDCGIEYINGERYVAYPMGGGRYSQQFIYSGKKIDNGKQHYIVRNCVFEPSLDDCSTNANATINCLRNIEAAFRWRKPAIISTHRVNFMGTRDANHRATSIHMLRELLSEIVKRWPDVEFMNGDQMADLMFKK